MLCEPMPLRKNDTQLSVDANIVAQVFEGKCVCVCVCEIGVWWGGSISDESLVPCNTTLDVFRL